MPISSVEIAAMNGAFQGVAMNNMAYSGMIGQGSPYGSGAGADAFIGKGMNRAGAIGGPLAAGAMGLMGLDPMSLGLKAGIGAYGAGAGVGGAFAVGGAVALPLMAGAAGAQYVGSQMYTGAQQQMALNQTLRGSFGFQNAYGGQGFQRSEMSAIGSSMREMTEHLGPGGEMTSFRELTQLAGKMGSMGFAQGVRDVQDFSRRFKEMVSSLKTMAKDLGTTLEGAMEFAAAAKQSGVFGMGGAAGFTGAVRAASVSGGLAVSEVTGAASIGSQISRSVGGLGRQGAMAGIRTIGQIGTAQQMGILSEEDIYNATGLTGADGRQAFAASQMQRSASWLRSGRGRRMLASVADRNGSLDESAVQEIMTGGMDISQTRSQDSAHLGRIGRANFIRNEGRLRGAAMERFGAFLPAMQLQEWARGKGIDINEMDDRTMLFAQRQLGMGRDEVDAAVRMATNMPQIMEQERRSHVQDSYFQQLGQMRKGQGVEGLKQRFSQARESINGKLQRIGQELFNEGSEGVDSFFNKLFGTYVQTYSKDIDDAYHTMRQGGGIGAAAGRRTFGIGGGMSSYAGALAARFGGGSTGMGIGDLSSRMGRGAMGGLGSDTLSYMAVGQSDLSKLQAAGFDLRGMTSQQMQSKLRDIETTKLAAATGFNKAQVTSGAQNADWIRRAYAYDKVEGSGDIRMQSFERMLQDTAAGGGTDGPRAKALLDQWRGAKSQAEKAQLMANIERGAQIQDKQALAGNYGLPEGLTSTLPSGGYGSVGEENRAWAQSMGYGDRRSRGERIASTIIGKGLSVIAETLTPTAAVYREHIEHAASDLIGRFTGSYAKEQAVGEFYKSERFRNLAYGVLSTNEADRGEAQRRLQDEIGKTGTEDAVRGEMQRMLRASEYSDLLQKTGGKPTPEQEAAVVKSTGMSVEELKHTVGNMYGAVSAVQKRDREEQSNRVRKYAGEEKSKLAQIGVYDVAKGGLTASLKGISEAGQKFVNLSIGATEYASAAGLDETTQSYYGSRGQFLEGMSVAEKRKLASTFAGTEMGGELGRSAAMQMRVDKMSHKYGAAGAAAKILGVDMSRDELKGLDLSGAGAGQLLARAGINDNNLVNELQRGAGKGGNLAEALRRITESATYQDEQKKKHLENQESQDPLQAAIKSNGDKTNQLLKEIARFSGVAADRLDKIGVKDPEKPPA